MTGLSRRSLLSGVAAATAAVAVSGGAPTPARAVAPPVGKQAPGWYRYKLGD